MQLVKTLPFVKLCDVQVCDSVGETIKVNAKIITNVKQSLAMREREREAMLSSEKIEGYAIAIF